MSDLKMQIAGTDAMRLMRGPHVVGMLLKMSNGRWGIYDRNERPLTKATYLQAFMARDKAAELIPT